MLFLQETLKKLTGIDPEEKTVNRKRKRPKGPNPLSCKKKKAEEGAKNKKKKKKKTGTTKETKLTLSSEPNQETVVTASVPVQAVK